MYRKDRGDARTDRSLIPRRVDVRRLGLDIEERRFKTVPHS
jgi:hypothetical protein